MANAHSGISSSLLLNWKLSLYFCCILDKILSITSVTVINAPTRV